MRRRDLLKGATAAGLSSALGCSALVRDENAHEGTRDWILTGPPTPKDAIRQPKIEGYCSRNSIRAGETIDFCASSASRFDLTLYRLGWYGGAGGRKLARLGPFPGEVQPDPPVGAGRVRECRWKPACSLRIPGDWKSGVYLGKLHAETGDESYVIFVVRDDRPCDFLFQVSDTTWAAYNRWPDLFSLYDDGTPPHHWYTGPGITVSFDRPYGKYRQIFDAPLSQGSGEFLLWEFPLAFWMEEQGYDVSYISNLDTHADPAGLLRAKAFLSVGHDEYWSREMFDHVKAAVDSGVNTAFFSGNAVDGLVDVRGRTISRVGKFGPFDHEVKKHGDRWTKHGPNPALLMGARSTFPYNGTADWTCIKPQHWLFEGTGLKAGDAFKGLVGWEHHGLPADLPGLEIVARGPVSSGGRPNGAEYTSTIHPGPKGNLVFNAATIWWSLGLSEPPGFKRPSAHGGTPCGPDPRVRRITQNLFRRFLA